MSDIERDHQEGTFHYHPIFQLTFDGLERTEQDENNQIDTA
jgi:hypothetical protein